MEKWPFFDQNLGLTFLVKCQFFHFLNFVFSRLERRFSTLEYRKRHFRGPYFLKKKVGKMAFFGPKPWVNPVWKNVNFSTFWTSSLNRLQRRFFALEYHKRHFLGLYFLKKKVGKKAIFWPKPWVNLFGKMSIFSTFWTFFFIV